MSTLPIICFDASPQSNRVGVGIYDKTNNVEISHDVVINSKILVNPQIAETMGLVCVLRYMQKNNINGAHIFTDNSSVAKAGISDELLLKYGIDKCRVTLNWIPREFNNHADYASRKQMSTTSVISKTNKVIKVQKSKNSVSSLPNLSVNTIEKFRETYNLSSRINILKKLASNDVQRNIIDCIERNERNSKLILEVLDSSHDNIRYLKMCAKIVTHNKFITSYTDVRGPKQRALKYNQIINTLSSIK